MDEQDRDRKGGFRVAAGVMDFLGVALNAVLILILLVVLTSLLTWLKQDLTESFSGITQNINEAVVFDATQAPVIQMTDAPQ